MKKTLLALAILAVAPVALTAGTDLPAVALHIEKHGTWNCSTGLPDVEAANLMTTYEGVGRIDAFVVFYNFNEAKGLSFRLAWPATWGEASWHDCGDLRLGTITHPGDATSIVWKGCLKDTVPMIAGWLTVTVTTPGKIEVLPADKEGVVALLDCNEVAPALSEVIICLKGGAGGAKGDDPRMMTDLTNRVWRVKPDSTGDVATLDGAVRQALPGDTVLVAGGTYHENLTLRQGVAILGSWDMEFTQRDFAVTPSIIDAHGHHPVVKSAFGEDSSTVLDGFVLTGGSGKQGGGIWLRKGSAPALRNLIIHSNSADYGGGIFCHASSPIIREVLIVANEADYGGGITCMAGSSPVIVRATIVGNRAETGAAIFAGSGSSPAVENSIIADHSDSSAIYAQEEASMILLSCCDLWSNATPQYGGQAEDSANLRSNMSDDPRFLNPEEMDFTPAPGSPVLSVDGCGRIGTRFGRVPHE
jgi:hypothetical protein